MAVNVTSTINLTDMLETSSFRRIRIDRVKGVIDKEHIRINNNPSKNICLLAKEIECCNCATD